MRVLVDPRHSRPADGLLVAAGFVPWLVIGLPAAAWEDRRHARPVMVTCDLVSAALLAH